MLQWPRTHTGSRVDTFNLMFENTFLQLMCQGKVERMNQILKKQMAFDFVLCVNWVRQVPSYPREINDRPKQCLKWKTPFTVYFGRRRNMNTHRRPTCWFSSSSGSYQTEIQHLQIRAYACMHESMYVRI